MKAKYLRRLYPQCKPRVTFDKLKELEGSIKHALETLIGRASEVPVHGANQKDEYRKLANLTIAANDNCCYDLVSLDGH